MREPGDDGPAVTNSDFVDDRPPVVTPPARQLGDGGRQGTTVDTKPAGRLPPQDLPAEAAVLSAILLESDAMDRVIDILKPVHFYSEANRRVFEAALALAMASKPIDIVTVAGELRNRDRLAHIGGAKYLGDLADAVPAVAHLETYAATVREKWRLRELISTTQRIAAEGYGDVGDPQTFIDGAENAVYQIAHETTQSPISRIDAVLVDVSKELENAHKNRGNVEIPTGLRRLDKKLVGLHRQELTVVGARPGMGKTALVLGIGENVASAVGPVGVFSLEMPKVQLVTRMAMAKAGIDLTLAREGMLRPDHWSAYAAAKNVLHQLPLFFDDTPTQNALTIRAGARRMARDAGQPLSLIIVDYLQLMSGLGNESSREQEISQISRKLKLLSREMDVPIIALSQLNRAVETRTSSKGKRPQLSDLRESGAVEQDADNIIFIYREEYYEPEKREVRGLAELDVAKQRNGPTGRVFVGFDGPTTTFRNLQPGRDPDGDD